MVSKTICGSSSLSTPEGENMLEHHSAHIYIEHIYTLEELARKFRIFVNFNYITCSSKDTIELWSGKPYYVSEGWTHATETPVILKLQKNSLNTSMYKNYSECIAEI